MRYKIGFWIVVLMFIGKSIVDHEKISVLEKQIKIKDSVIVSNLKLHPHVK